MSKKGKPDLLVHVFNPRSLPQQLRVQSRALEQLTRRGN